MNKIQTLKGFRDIKSKDIYERQWLKSKIVEVFEKWGYEPLETPILEALELFKGNIGEDEKLFYKFKDNGGRDVALRYDQTVPACRFVAENFNDLVFPYKRYQIQMAYRAEKPQKGRYREFLQCDGDIFGVKSVSADAEIIAVSLDIYKNIGFKNAKVLINDRELMKDIPYVALSSIDKIKKIGKDGVIEDMQKKGINKSDANKYLEAVLNLKPSDDIKYILNYLKEYGFDEKMFAFDPTIIRSFSYSTGPIWEVVYEGSNSSLLGGERYDELVKKISGKDIPGTGFGLGFDRTLEAAKELNLVPDFENPTEIVVAALSDKNTNKVLELASNLRSKGFNIDNYLSSNEKLEKVIKYAVKKNARYIGIIGDNEAKQNKILVKDLRENKQVVLSEKELIDYLKKTK